MSTQSGYVYLEDKDVGTMMKHKTERNICTLRQSFWAFFFKLNIFEKLYTVLNQLVKK